MAHIGHPHNAALQIWVELGFIGAALAAAVLACVLRGLYDLPLAKLAPRLTLLTGGAAIALVGHGAWQGWWAAALGAALVWLRCAERLLGETSPSRDMRDDRL
jgi:O-antigen ligase